VIRTWTASSLDLLSAVHAAGSSRKAQRQERRATRAAEVPRDRPAQRHITVTEPWRLGRNLQDLIAIVGDLRRREIGFKSLHEALDTTTPGGRLVFHVFAALGEFIREMIVQGTREGLDAARARGARLGQPPAMSTEQVQHARDPLGNPDNTVSSIARPLGVSRATIYKYVPELSSPALTAAAAPVERPAGADARGTAGEPPPMPAPVCSRPTR